MKATADLYDMASCMLIFRAAAPFMMWKYVRTGLMEREENENQNLEY